MAFGEMSSKASVSLAVLMNSRKRDITRLFVSAAMIGSIFQNMTCHFEGNKTPHLLCSDRSSFRFLVVRVEGFCSGTWHEPLAGC